MAAEPRNETIVNMLKSQQWERVKGEIRAFVRMQGSYPGRDGSTEHQRWIAIHNTAVLFIKEVEDNGLHE